MNSFVSALLRPRNGWQTMAASMLVYNPIITIGYLIVTGARIWPHWLVTLAIADAVTLQCFGAIHVYLAAERLWYRRRGRSKPEHKRWFYFAQSIMLMPLALPVGFRIGGFVSTRLGGRWSPPDFADYRVGLVLGAVFAGVFFLHLTRQDARDAARAAEARILDLENKRLQAQVAALSAEMNPHLLFNALNTVAALVHSDPDRAEDVVLQLSEMYRGVLRSSGQSTHALADELRLCEAYLRVEQARFGERLKWRVEIDRDRVDAKKLGVPVLLLQPVVENAVKHGVAPRASGGEVVIEVKVNDGVLALVVRDDGVGLGNSPARGNGMAVENAKKRLELLYPGRASMSLAPRAEGGTVVSIEIPASEEGPEVKS